MNVSPPELCLVDIEQAGTIGGPTWRSVRNDE
jgi:hypothetical protein